LEWVEVTGKTLEEAKEAALGQLGVAEGDAELVIVAEPKAGLFGRMRGEARVRARVRPVGPRPKRTRRPRERSKTAGGTGGGRSPGESEARTPDAGSGDGPSGANRSRNRNRRRRSGSGSGGGGGDRAEATSNGGTRAASSRREGEDMAEGMTLEEQAEVGREFLSGLIEQFGITATVDTRVLDEETVEIAAKGDGLGILVGPRGTTLAALQDLTRTAVQRRCPSRTDRILVDIAGYREKRSAALRKFTQQIAEEVLASGDEQALEPMSPADRKVVHDTVNEIEGLVTRSEGEDAGRYVVVAPA
jgi:spoIIIJ-associated protein